MTHMRCTIHDFEFTLGKLPAGFETWAVRCPLCANEEQTKLQGELETVTRHRDLLLEAIELKRTLVRRARRSST